MTLRLTLDVEPADEYDDVNLVPALHNDGDEAVTFSTPDASVFTVEALDPDGNPINGLDSGLAAQVCSEWVVEPGDALTRTLTWHSKGMYEALPADHDVDNMWEDFPEDYGEIEVTVAVRSGDEAVSDLTLTERVELP